VTDNPAMLLWTDAYLGDTKHLTTLEHGAYLLLLMAMWRAGGSLPNDERRLARTAGLPLDKWRKIAPAILSFMTIDGVMITQKRLMLEFKIQSCRTEKRASAGRAGGRAKALKLLKQPPSNATFLVKQNPSLPEPEPEPVRKEEIKPSVANDRTVSARGADPPPPKKRIVYPPDFEAFWKAYPTDRNMSKTEALGRWKRLGADDREAATRSCPSFRAYCEVNAKSGYRPVHAERYLKERRFEGHAEAAERTKTQVFAKIGTPQWLAWERWFAEARGKKPPVNKEGTGWWFKSEWPEAKQDENAQ
jgi:uncharacterized protein YdaU (DUF1376 family)